MSYFNELEKENPILIAKHKKLALFFAGSKHVLELGPGLGVFLNLMQQTGIRAEGVDNDKPLVAHCRAQGLKVHLADGHKFLKKLTPGAFDGFFTSNVIEHLEPEELITFFDLVCSKLAVKGRLALITSNPKALGVHADSFYTALDHRRLYPLDLLKAMLEERGMRVIDARPDEDSRAGSPLRSLVRTVRTILVGPFFGPPEIYITAEKTTAPARPGSSHLTHRR